MGFENVILSVGNSQGWLYYLRSFMIYRANRNMSVHVLSPRKGCHRSDMHMKKDETFEMAQFIGFSQLLSIFAQKSNVLKYIKA